MLICMVTCRNTDKKPYDNIVKVPTVNPGLNNSVLKYVGGDTFKHLHNIDGMTSVLKEANSILNGVTANSVATKSAIAASALASPSVGLGKIFAPLSGNWHRTSG